MTSKFKLPSNIHFEHNKQADQMMQEQAKTVIQNLLAGKHPVNAGARGQMAECRNKP